MLNWSSLAIFVSIVLVIVVTPGPNSLYIVARSLDGGYYAGLASCLGILLATATHIVAASVGLTALLLSSPVIFNIIKYAGAIYLIWVGLRTITSKHDSETTIQTEKIKWGAIVYQGFVINLLNPKTALFFLAFLPQFVNTSLGRVKAQIILLGVILALLGTTSDSLYALLAGRARRWLQKNFLFVRSLRYVSASVYIGLGLLAALKAI
jgi:threonine/homoserine/homoserine lactone efflux protein